MKRGFCPKCGALNAGFLTYCLICEAPLPTMRSAEQKQTAVPFQRGGTASRSPDRCSQCGAILRSNVKFCTQCGAKVGFKVT